MVTNRETQVAGVRYYLSFRNEPMGVVTTMAEVIATVDRNPGMTADAEVWKITDFDYGVEECQPRYQVYPPLTA